MFFHPYSGFIGPVLLLFGLCSRAEGEQKFRIEGRALVSGVTTEQWSPFAHVLLDTEEHAGFIRLDGSFTVNDVPSGSHVVHIMSPVYRFEAVRVDITATGKIRARKVNYLKISEVVQLPYPIQMRCTGQHSYFIKRDTWGWTDFLMNPMVLMMVVPVLIIFFLPKLVNMNDPEMRTEMEQSMNMLNHNPELPDVSELMTKFFAPLKAKVNQDLIGSTEAVVNAGDNTMTPSERKLLAFLSIVISAEVQATHHQAGNIHLLPPEEQKLIQNLGHKELPRDCHELWESSGGQARDGIYMIKPRDSPIVAFCAMQEGGWTVIQHITVNGSVHFDRSWEEYKLGFGTLTGNHWLGNEYIHQLTSGPIRYKLGIKLVDKDAVTKTGEYDPTLVEGEDAQYRLRLGVYHGTAVDALTLEPDNYLHDNQKFTTKDRDNDNYFQNCAKLEFQGVSGGGWWYDACAGANLNRRNVIYWQKDCNKEHLCKYAWMMVKPSDTVKIIRPADCKRDEL